MKFLNKIDGADKLITDANNRLVKDIDISKWNNGVIPNIGNFHNQGALITYILTNQLASGLYRTGLGDASDCLLALHDWNTHYKATVYTPNQVAYAKVSKTGVVEDFIEIWNEDLSKIANIDNKVDKVSGKGLSDENYTLAEKNKLAGIEAGANKYIHPSTHSANMITENTSRRFVSDAEKASWNKKAEISDIPIKTSQLINDSGFLTTNDLVPNISTGKTKPTDGSLIWYEEI